MLPMANVTDLTPDSMHERHLVHFVQIICKENL